MYHYAFPDHLLFLSLFVDNLGRIEKRVGESGCSHDISVLKLAYRYSVRLANEANLM